MDSLIQHMAVIKDMEIKEDKEDTIISIDQIKENLKIQLEELESLQSMFCNPGEIRIENNNDIIQETNLFLNGQITDIPSFLDFTINLLIEEWKFELCITLSHEYPNIEPEIFVRYHELNKLQHSNLNKHLNTFISNLERGVPCIFSAISWLQDNVHNYIIIKSDPVKSIVRDEQLIRYWIYSHHIYSKRKRREINDLANELKLTGFCLPGKPGIMCIEGPSNDCNEWWQSIKSMNWKRIFCKIIEKCEENCKDTFLKFHKFEEVSFQNSNIKCNHMDMGGLYKYLENHSCNEIFKEIFGVDVKNTN